jgi:hypothetical protein
VIKTNAYNNAKHRKMFAGDKLFNPESASSEEVSIVGVPRDSTWTKVFDFNNEGLTEHNFQAYNMIRM